VAEMLASFGAGTLLGAGGDRRAPQRRRATAP
jgi:hypothetical protein